MSDTATNKFENNIEQNKTEVEEETELSKSEFCCECCDSFRCHINDFGNLLSLFCCFQ